jgi:hypothetical protein
MGATKRDVSGVFDAELRGPAKATRRDRGFVLNHNGLTFVSDACLREWTEIGVRVQFPKGQPITCRAVVVHCAPRAGERLYDVALLFLDVPKAAGARLDLLPATTGPLSVSITR